MSDINRLVVAWVSAQQRHFHASTRGIATPEQRMAWEREAEEIIAAHDPGPCITPSKYGCRECSNEPAKGNQP